MPKPVKGTVRVGLIGAGGISAAHANGYLKHTDKIHVVAIADISKAGRNQRNAQLGGDCALFSDWKTMLKKMGDTIDAVDICLPHHLHKAAIVDGARAGKHILCEKPMCMSLREADAIQKAVEAAGITYMSAHNQLFLPVVQAAKQMISSGQLGRIYWIRSQDCFTINRSKKEWGWRAEKKHAGGGELIDTGYHPTYRLYHLAGAEPAAVRASFSRFHCKIEGEDTASVSVRFANGTIGEILTSWAFRLPTGSHSIHVMGEKGEVYGSGNELYYKPEGYASPARRQLPGKDTFTEEIGHFATVLQKGQRPLHSVAEGRTVLKLILDATQSAKDWEKTAVQKMPGD